MAEFYPADIREFRQKLGLTQRRFGEAIGVPQTTIYRWEKGLSQPNASNLSKMFDLGRSNGIEPGFFQVKGTLDTDKKLENVTAVVVSVLRTLDSEVRSVQRELSDFKREHLRSRESDVALAAESQDVNLEAPNRISGETSTVPQSHGDDSSGELAVGLSTDYDKSSDTKVRKGRSSPSRGRKKVKKALSPKEARERRKEYQRQYYLERREKAKEYQRQYNRLHKKQGLPAAKSKNALEFRRETQKTTYNTHDIMHAPAEETLKILQKIISGERMFTM